jgi:hypothetical protein
MARGRGVTLNLDGTPRKARSDKGVPRLTDPRLFWVRVTPGPHCWTYPTNGHEYGRVRWNGVYQYAHRLVWEWMNGPIPKGLFVCHHCDTPRCVRPSHLFLGDIRANNRDRIAKGRFGIGVFREVTA